MRSRAARSSNVTCRAFGSAITASVSNFVKVRETVSIVRPRWSAISCRDIGNSISFVAGARSAISKRKAATRSLDVLINSVTWA